MNTPYGRGALRNAAIRPSVRPSVCPMPLARGAFHGYDGFYRCSHLANAADKAPATDSSKFVAVSAVWPCTLCRWRMGSTSNTDIPINVL